MRTRPLPGSSPWSYAFRGIVGILFGAILLLTPGIGLASFVPCLRPLLACRRDHRLAGGLSVDTVAPRRLAAAAGRTGQRGNRSPLPPAAAPVTKGHVAFDHRLDGCDRDLDHRLGGPAPQGHQGRMAARDRRSLPRPLRRLPAVQADPRNLFAADDDRRICAVLGRAFAGIRLSAVASERRRPSRGLTPCPVQTPGPTAPTGQSHCHCAGRATPPSWSFVILVQSAELAHEDPDCLFSLAALAEWK